MNPVPPVMKTFRLENQSDIDGSDTFDVIFFKQKAAKYFFNEQKKKIESMWGLTKTNKKTCAKIREIKQIINN